jgi:hypothetical protein
MTIVGSMGIASTLVEKLRPTKVPATIGNDRQRYSRNRCLIAWYSDVPLRLALSRAAIR